MTAGREQDAREPDFVEIPVVEKDGRYYAEASAIRAFADPLAVPGDDTDDHDCPTCGPREKDARETAEFLDVAVLVALKAHWWSATDDETCSCGWVAPGWADAGTGNDDDAEHAAIEVAHAAFLLHQTEAIVAALLPSPPATTAGAGCTCLSGDACSNCPDQEARRG